MKNLIYLGILMFYSTLLFGRNNTNPDINVMKINSGNGSHIQFYGENALCVTDSIFSHFNIKSNKSIKKIRKVKVDGFDKPITLEIHSGYHGLLTNKTDSNTNGGYFSASFTKKRNKEWFESNRTSDQTYAVWIYVKRGRSFGLKTDKEYELIKDFITSLYGS